MFLSYVALTCPTYAFSICCWYFFFFASCYFSSTPNICVPHMAALENLTVNIILITPSVCVQCTTNSEAQTKPTRRVRGSGFERDPTRHAPCHLSLLTKGRDGSGLCARCGIYNSCAGAADVKIMFTTPPSAFSSSLFVDIGRFTFPVL